MGGEGSEAAPSETPPARRLIRHDGLVHDVVDFHDYEQTEYITDPAIALQRVTNTFRTLTARLSCGKTAKYHYDKRKRLTTDPTTCFACVVIYRYP